MEREDQPSESAGGVGSDQATCALQRFTVQPVLICSRGSMNFVLDHGTEQGDRIFIYFCGEKSVSKAAMKTCVWLAPAWNLAGHPLTPRFIGSVDKMGAKRGIMIFMEKLSSVAAKVC